MADNPSVDPTERNAKKLIRIFVEHFALGATATDLRLRYEELTSLRNASFFNALRRCKENGWLIGGGRHQEYLLNSSGAWKAALRPPFLEDGQERDQLVRAMELQEEKIARLESRNRQLRSAKRAVVAGETAGTTVATLAQLMADQTVTMRRRLQAAELLLSYRTLEDVATAAKVFLSSLASDPEQSVDIRLGALAALRKVEGDPRIAPSVQRPDLTPVRFDTQEQIAARHERRKKHIELQARLNAEAMEAERQQMLASNGRPVVRN
jgi:hypothetical protein